MLSKDNRNYCVPNPSSQKEKVICIYFMLPKSYWNELADEKKGFVVDGDFKTWGWYYVKTYDIIIFKYLQEFGVLHNQ